MLRDDIVKKNTQVQECINKIFGEIKNLEFESKTIESQLKKVNQKIYFRQ